VLAVINETLRLFPPVPLNVRESRERGCVLPMSDATHPEAAKLPPLYMPARTTFSFSTLLTQRNQSLWGDDADEFDPDRWIDPQRSAKVSANPAMFAPFAAGPRLVSRDYHFSFFLRLHEPQCLGQSYAYNQISYFVVRLLQQFDKFTLAPEVQPAGSLPPEIWKSRKGRQSFERIWPSAAMTLYVKVQWWCKFWSVEHVLN
jgi:cytochrome P450